MASDLELAIAHLNAKNKAYTTLWKYYDGDHPLMYSTERLKAAFESINVKFVQNWCSVVVDSTLDKLVLKRFVVADDKKATKVLNDLWWDTEMKLDDDDVHLAMLVTGESFVIAWPDGDELEAYYNDPRMVHIEYDPEHPRRKRFAAKWWVDTDDYIRLTFYYPNRLEYWRSTRTASVLTKANQIDARQFTIRERREHPYGIVSAFHYRRERRKIRGELTDSVLSQQDAVNKLLADMMVAAEFGAFKQRWVISNADTEGKLKNAPNEIWSLPGGDGFGQGTQVGEFAGEDLGKFMAQIERLATGIAVITKTPRHYFFERAGSNPSGEALMAMEAPLNSKVERLVERLQMPYAELAQFLLRLKGIEVDRRAITPVFKDPQTLQPLTRAQARQTNVSAGMPLVTVLRQEGQSEEDIAQMQKDKREEQAENVRGLAQALVQQQRDFDQNGGGGDGQLNKEGAQGDQG